jgi:Arc/MetJ-type ribon-helix-helix transcriptional regulator
MKKTQVYLPEEDLAALHATAERTGKSVAELIREAIRQVWLRPADGPGELGRARPHLRRASSS